MDAFLFGGVTYCVAIFFYLILLSDIVFFSKETIFATCNTGIGYLKRVRLAVYIYEILKVRRE